MKRKNRKKTVLTKKNMKNKKSVKTKKSNLTLILFLVVLMVVFLFGYIAVKNGIFNLLDSEAQSKNYNKTYAAGKLVNYKPAGYKYERGKLVSVASQGKTIKMPAKPGGPTIDGWTMNHADEKYTSKNEGWVYLSKWFTIPKSKRPMAVYVCWRALSKNTSIKLRLSKGVQDVWRTKAGLYHKNYTHQFEADPNRYREIACWGFYDVVYQQVVPRSHPQNEPIKPGQYMKKVSKSVKAKLFIKVPEGGIELASVKVFEPTKPPENAYYERQNEVDITK